MKKKTLIQTLIYGLLAFPVWGISGGIESGNINPATAGSGSGIASVSADGAPQLGGNLDGNGKIIRNVAAIEVGSMSVTGPAVLSSTNDVLNIIVNSGLVGGATFQVCPTSVTMNGASISGSGVQAGDTTTWTGAQYFASATVNAVSGVVNSVFSISTGTQKLFDVTGSSVRIVTNLVVGDGIAATAYTNSSLGVSVVNGRGAAFTARNVGGNVETYLASETAIGVVGTQTNHPFYIRTNASNVVTVETSGNVGINTTGPASRLDVRNGSATIRGTGAGLIIKGGSLTVRGQDGTSGLVFSVTTGTVDNGGGRLFCVYGTSITMGVKLFQDQPAADYALAKDYKRLSLGQIKAFVRQNGHLPWMPKGSDIESGKVSDGELHKSMTESIENLVLIAIDTDRKLNILYGLISVLVLMCVVFYKRR